MSDLTRFRDHARRMATAQHKLECPSLGPPSRPVWEGVYEQDDGIPSALRWVGNTEPPPHCPGCVTDAERADWVRLAAEVDTYLDPHPTLWEDA